MAEKLFFGTPDTVNPVVNGNQNHHIVNPNTSIYTGKLTRITTNVLVAGSTLIQVYNLITNEMILNTGYQSVTPGVNNISISPIDVTASMQYGIGATGQPGGTYCEYSNSAGRYYRLNIVTHPWTPPNPINLGLYSSDTANRMTIGAYGWEPPQLTDCDGDNEIIDTQQNVLLNGVDFMPSGAQLFMTDSPVYASSTKFVPQSINAQNDNQIDFNVQRGDLDLGAAYLHVITSIGQMNDVGLQINLLPSIQIQDLANNILSITGNTGQMIGYEEPVAPEEVLPLDMYRFLLEPIRQADNTREGALFVKRLLQGPQLLWQQTIAKIFALKKLLSVVDCPDELLQYLKNIVGWTTELDCITERLDYDSLRRLIAASPELWKTRGREETIVNLLSLVTGARCLMWNWFDYRWITGETIFGEIHEGNDPWIIDVPGPPDYGENYSTLRIVDNGDLDRTLIIYLVNFMRAISERIEIVYTQFFDRFLVKGDDTQWTLQTGTTPMVVENGYAALSDNTSQHYSVIDNDYSMNWKDYVYYAKMSSDGYFGVVFYNADEDNYYKFMLRAGYTDYLLAKNVGGTPSTILSGNLPVAIQPDVWVGIRVHIEDDGGTNRIKVYLDGDEIINTTDSSLSNGTAGFFNGASSTCKLDEAELFTIPLETDLVDINS